MLKDYYTEKVAKMKLQKMLFLLFMGILMAVAGEAQQTAYDFELFDGVELESLNHDGNARISHAKIMKTTRVHGRLICNDSDLWVTLVDGDAYFKKSTFTGRVAIKGSFVAEESNFMENIELTTNKAIIRNSRLNTILVFPVMEGDAEQCIEIYNSDIKGSVVFYSKKGKVMMDADSIIRGEVVGGEIAIKK